MAYATRPSATNRFLVGLHSFASGEPKEALSGKQFPTFVQTTIDLDGSTLQIFFALQECLSQSSPPDQSKPLSTSSIIEPLITNVTLVFGSQLAYSLLLS
jgi:hypothetical protein